MTCLRSLSALFALSLFTLPLAAQEPTLTDIKRGLDELRSLVEQSNLATFKDLVDLRKRLQTLESTVQSMQRGQDRIALYPPQAPTGTGTIRLENRLSVPATVVVNDTPYRLQPFQNRDLTAQAPGTFTFEVLVDGYGSLQPRATRSLEPNRTYTIYTYMP
jgi:hypothetical protein